MAGGELRFGAPVALFSVRPPSGLLGQYSPLAVSRDGSRIFFPQGVEQPDSNVIHVKTSF
jgi:hypothetical protein